MFQSLSSLALDIPGMQGHPRIMREPKSLPHSSPRADPAQEELPLSVLQVQGDPSKDAKLVWHRKNQNREKCLEGSLVSHGLVY